MCAITPLWARAARHTLSRYSWMDDMAATLAGRSARGNPAPETRVRSLPCVVELRRGEVSHEKGKQVLVSVLVLSI